MDTTVDKRHTEEIGVCLRSYRGQRTQLVTDAILCSRPT